MIILTGSTGHIGQYLLHQFLCRDVPVAVIVRPRDGVAASDRIERQVQHWEGLTGAELPRPVCLEGDIRHQRFGLGSEDLKWVRRHGHILLQNAACVDFANRANSSSLWETNVGGAERALEFCQATSIHNLHYVSTAYVSGDRKGTVYEDELDCGQEFHNLYEQSKFEAERLITKSKIVDQTTVYRPAIVLGDSVNGYTTTYHAIYVLAYFTHYLARHSARDTDGRWYHPVRLDLNGDEGRNLVPVNWVSQVIAHIAATPRLHGRTYHIGPSSPTTAAEIEQAMSEYFQYHGVKFVGRQQLTGKPVSSSERLFYAHISRYMPYWHEDPVFDLAHTAEATCQLAEPRIDIPALKRMFDYAVENNFGR